MKHILPFLKPYKWRIALAMVLIATATVCDLLLPEAQTQPFLARVFDISAGTIEGLVGDSEYRDFPVEVDG